MGDGGHREMSLPCSRLLRVFEKMSATMAMIGLTELDGSAILDGDASAAVEFDVVRKVMELLVAVNFVMAAFAHLRLLLDNQRGVAKEGKMAL